MSISLQEVLHAEIPITKAMGVCVVEESSSSLTLSAPLENNINHKCTAFGGSLYSISVLSGWGLLYLLMKERGLTGHIVIQESNIQYIKPVTDIITSTCTFNSSSHADKFVSMFQRKGIARIKLESRISDEFGTQVLFTGQFVAHQHQ